jgi:hypothetical protein
MRHCIGDAGQDISLFVMKEECFSTVTLNASNSHLYEECFSTITLSAENVDKNAAGGMQLLRAWQDSTAYAATSRNTYHTRASETATAYQDTRLEPRTIRVVYILYNW